MTKEEKLDWIYKGANSLVDREEYLLGRKVDNPLEQLNQEEKEKKFILPIPKNHVEHECIPPSIRDFNKIVQAEQVDLSAKLQEDPLVAIKKREEEARRQFLQNPVQLKKLQDALKKKADKERHKNTKRKYTDSNLDEQIKEKLKKLKSKSFGVQSSKKELKKGKDDMLNTILMHKFNALKDKLSEEDLKDIMNGKTSDSSDEDESKKEKEISTSSDSDSKAQKIARNKSTSFRNSYRQKPYNNKKFEDRQRNPSNKQFRTQESSDEESRKIRYTGKRKENNDGRRNRSFINDKQEKRLVQKYNQTPRGRSRSPEAKRRERCQTDTRIKKRRETSKRKEVGSSEDEKANLSFQQKKLTKDKRSSNDGDSDSDLDKKIMMRLKILRQETEIQSKQKPLYPQKPPHLIRDKDSSSYDSSESEEIRDSNVHSLKISKLPIKRKNSSSSSCSERQEYKYRYSDSEDEGPRLKSFGLVSSDGKKIALKKTGNDKKVNTPVVKIIEKPAKADRKHVKKMTDEEKEKLRENMMMNAKARDKEREENVRRYKEKDKREEDLVSKKYDADIVHAKLLKTADHSSVEERIKSKLNNIQRSSRHMDNNFSKR